jgi:hypothetical protein
MVLILRVSIGRFGTKSARQSTNWFTENQCANNEFMIIYCGKICKAQLGTTTK